MSKMGPGRVKTRKSLSDRSVATTTGILEAIWPLFFDACDIRLGNDTNPLWNFVELDLMSSGLSNQLLFRIILFLINEKISKER